MSEGIQPDESDEAYLLAQVREVLADFGWLILQMQAVETALQPLMAMSPGAGTPEKRIQEARGKSMGALLRAIPDLPDPLAEALASLRHRRNELTHRYLVANQLTLASPDGRATMRRELSTEASQVQELLEALANELVRRVSSSEEEAAQLFAIGPGIAEAVKRNPAAFVGIDPVKDTARMLTTALSVLGLQLSDDDQAQLEGIATDL